VSLRKRNDGKSKPRQCRFHCKLKALGLDDRAILDATLVLSYFNFVNRIVLGLGLGLGLAVSEEELAGYKYD
jgi:hypothetical protein